MPRRVKFNLYEAPAALKNSRRISPDWTPLYSDLEPWIDMRAMPHVRLPENEALDCGKAKRNSKRKATTSFNCARSTAPASSSSMEICCWTANETDWGQTEAKLHLSAGAHAIKVNFCGKSDFMTIGYSHCRRRTVWAAAAQKESLPTLYLFSK